jgi:hypothetical protein
VSCHFISYLEKTKGFHFYCPDRHTKYVEMRHTIFLEVEMMRGSTVPQEISLEEKRVNVPTSMIHELIPPVPVHEHIIPIFEVGYSSTSPNENKAPVIDEEENQPQNLENNCDTSCL